MNYNTDINTIGSIPNYHSIYKALPWLTNDPEQLENILITNNKFDFRTEKSRKKFLSVLNSAFVSKNKISDELVSTLMLHCKNDDNAQSVLLFWLFSMNNKLFFELNRDLFLKYYFQGPFGINESEYQFQKREMKIFQKNKEEIAINMVMFMVEALNLFKEQNTADIKQSASEIRRIVTQGFNPNKRDYIISSIDNKKFSIIKC